MFIRKIASDCNLLLNQKTLSKNLSHKAPTTPVQDEIIAKLTREFQPVHIEVENESNKHLHSPTLETHFKVLIVSHKFDGLSLLDQHKHVNSILDPNFKSGLHAVSLRTYTPEKWNKINDTLNFESPKCAGK